MNAILKMVAELIAEGQTVVIETGSHVDDTVWVRIRDRDEKGRSFPLFDRNGDLELSASGATVQEAYAQLDVICSRPMAAQPR